MPSCDPCRQSWEPETLYLHSTVKARRAFRTPGDRSRHMFIVFISIAMEGLFYDPLLSFSFCRRTALQHLRPVQR